jgi:hypothetical protein
MVVDIEYHQFFFALLQSQGACHTNQSVRGLQERGNYGTRLGFHPLAATLPVCSASDGLRALEAWRATTPRRPEDSRSFLNCVLVSYSE